MPEYLAPGVYVEEIDTGSKPIEGVSTSTAGMVGVTERGPVNIPILITSFGEYRRWFGDYLNQQTFGDHRFLPHAIEGFFTNGGQRVYVVRVLDEAAALRSSFTLHNRGTNQSAFTWLLRAAGENTGSSGTPPIYVVNINAAVPNTGTLANADRIRIGGGSDAEYRVVSSVVAAASTTHVPVSLPLSKPHANAAQAHHINRVVVGGALTLDAAAPLGSTTIALTGTQANIAAVVEGVLLEIGNDQFSSEHRFVTRRIPGADNTHISVGLDSPLLIEHTNGENVQRLNSDPTVAAVLVRQDSLSGATSPGATVAFVANRGGDFDDRDDLVVFNLLDANPALRSARRIGLLSLLVLSTGAYGDYPASSIVRKVAQGVGAGAAVLTQPARAGESAIRVDTRVNLAEGDLIRIGTSPNEEYIVIAGLPNPSPGNAAPNAGVIMLGQPLSRDYASNTPVREQVAPVPDLARPLTASVLPVPNGSALLVVSDGGVGASAYANNDLIEVTRSDGQITYHRLAQNMIALDARPVEVAVPLAQSHAAGSSVAERQALLNVVALDAGEWGNRLRVSVEDEQLGLVSATSIHTIIDATHFRLTSATGIEQGTILELLDPLNTNAVIGDLLKVVDIDRASNNTITLAPPGLSQAQQDAQALAVGAGQSIGVRSREFRLTVRLLAPLSQAVPSRDGAIQDTEVFRYLSMDPRHSNYIQRVIGATFTPGSIIDDSGQPLQLEDRRSSGTSQYIRVRDLAANQAELESIRLGPETLIDILPGGTQRAARHSLAGGNDQVGGINDNRYIGSDHNDPAQRTGLWSLTNIEQISLVACPGHTTVTMQGALINHCELMRYRFAVLDGPPPPEDSLANVQTQRQQYDTKYAALYHPWLLIPDPFPATLAKIPDYPIPPSGHILGVYARTDIERGVHKAPANEVVRGIIGLQRELNKREQDILNPSPVNINVIRDFRPNNRGLRVWGARVITSDPDWKYVNVRRLLIFIEASVDRGLQWVVFEPNAEPLWARVRRSISNFLTTVWRNGALEGTRVEEAFFVKCDRTTMTQTDIDNGKLIVLIGVAPVKPAEFVIIRIGLWTARAEE